jgi:hypothetical protein
LGLAGVSICTITLTASDAPSVSCAKA